jgi:small nuclear ribonucleoprotein (snRNP)-like protein
MTEPPSYDPYVLTNASSADTDSPLEYVRTLLGKRLAVLLLDGRVIVGTFSALNWNGNMHMKKALEYYDDTQRELGNIVCSLHFVQEMEIRKENPN